MKPAAFRYHRPATLDEALALLAEHGDAAKLIAGGQSLVPMMNLRLAQPAELIDLGDLRELGAIEEADGRLVVGALVRHQALADSQAVRRCCALLAEAAAGIGHYAVRQRGTLGGSLAHADPAAQLPLVAVTLQAEIELASQRGRRRLAAADFPLAVMTTALAADELIVGVRFPVARSGDGSAFRLFSRRHGDFALVAVAARLRVQGERVAQLDLGVGGVEPVPVRLGELAARQQGRIADAAWVSEVAAAARGELDVPQDARVSRQYRHELIETLVARALTAALDDARTRNGAKT
jgi:carbon-monoxide dehydrogenase medium subunit